MSQEDQINRAASALADICNNYNFNAHQIAHVITIQVASTIMSFADITGESHAKLLEDHITNVKSQLDIWNKSGAKRKAN